MRTRLTRERERPAHGEYGSVVQQHRWHERRARNVRPLVEWRERAQTAAIEQRGVQGAELLCTLRAERPVARRSAAGRTAHRAQQHVDCRIGNECEARRVAEQHGVAQGVCVVSR